MRAGNEGDRPIEFIHFVQEQGKIYRPALGHFVDGMPGAVVLVPGQVELAEGRLGNDFELVGVDRAMEQLHGRLHHAGVAQQQGEGLAITLQAMGQQRHAGSAAGNFRPVEGKNPRQIRAQHRRLFLREEFRYFQISPSFICLDLFGIQQHKPISFRDQSMSGLNKIWNKGFSA